MKINSNNNFFDWLPPELRQEARQRLELALSGIHGIRWPIKAVVLGGGYKHREITYQQELGSDIDIFVFSNFIPFFWGRLKQLEKQANAEKFIFHYRGVLPMFLSQSKTFWAYKLKHESIVLAGDPTVLDKITAEENNISKIEASRILFQTLGTWIKPLETKMETNDFSVLRIYLNIGEAYLTYFGKLKPSYKARQSSFENNSENFGISDELKSLITLGYLTKTDPKKAEVEIHNHQLSLAKAKDDCLEVIKSLTGDVDDMKKSAKPNYLFNLFLIHAIKKMGLRPNIFSLFFGFNLFSLYQILFLAEIGKKDEALKNLRTYIQTEKFNDELLIKLLEIPPLPVMIQIS